MSQNPIYIQRMAESLMRAAKGLDSPPSVEFDVQWVEVTSMDSDGREWAPVITFKVKAEVLLDIEAE